MISLDELMQACARLGIKEWRAVDSKLKKLANGCLGSKRIAERESEANKTIATFFKKEHANEVMFIPLPSGKEIEDEDRKDKGGKPSKSLNKRAKKEQSETEGTRVKRIKDFECAFFAPIRTTDSDGTIVSFDVVLIFEEGSCLGFRIEHADKPHDGKPSEHNYSHVQMCRKMLRKTLCIKNTPNWIPESYPAFPTPASDSIEMFLFMLIAIYGSRTGGVNILQGELQGISRTSVINQCNLLVAKMLRWQSHSNQ